MQNRDLVAAAAGLALAAALAWFVSGLSEWASTGTPPMPAVAAAVQVPREPGEAAAALAPVPALPPAPAAAGPFPVETSRTAARDLAFATAGLDLSVQGLLLSKAGAPAGPGGEGRPYRGNPFAGKDPAALSEQRESADRKSVV